MIINAKDFWKRCNESYIYACIHMSSSVPHSILLRDPQSNLLLSLLLVAHQNLMTLLLKTPNTLVIRHGNIMLVLIRKFPPFWIAFLVLESDTLAVWVGVIYQQSYPDINPLSYKNYWIGKTWTWMQQWHTFYEFNQQHFVWN